ncbi:hypothetical protein F4703DRAFT_1798774 [Phycomyces blakesleeanus]
MKPFTFLLALAWLSSVHGYFYVPNFMASLPFKGGMSYAQVNSSIVMFGGENATTSFTNNLYQLTQTETSFTWNTLPQQNPPEGSVYGQSVVSSTGTSLLQLGGITQSAVAYLSLNTTVPMPLQLHMYSFATGAWSSPNITGAPVNRNRFSATIDSSNKIYIYGGALIQGTVLSDLWVLDANAGTYTQLQPTDVGHYGHTTSILSDGRLVVLGGVSPTLVNGQAVLKLAPMNMAYVYDPKAATWTKQQLNPYGANYPTTRSGHTASVTSDGKIILFGGDNGGTPRSKLYLNNVATLDTNTWTWSFPEPAGIPPSRRTNCIGAILDGKHLTVAFGEALNSYYNDINVMSIDDSAWLQSFGAVQKTSKSGISTGVIVGVTIAAVALVAIILFLLWRFKSYVIWLAKRIHADIWKPRSGEPVWAETTRIIFQVFFLFLFVMFLVFVIKQAVDSPNVTQRIEVASAEVETPDVRFCFDGYPTYPIASDTRNPGVVCQTNTGYSCSSYIQPLNMSVFEPTFADKLGAVSCYLFRSDPSFKMSATSGDNNGSHLIFSFFGDNTITSGRVHVSIFPKSMDPNVKVYGINDEVPVLISDQDVLNWQNAERNDLQATNVYTIEPFSYSAMSYDIIDHRYMQPVGWNYVGFLPIYNHTSEVDSNFRQEAPNPNYVALGHSDIGLIAVIPNTWASLTDREVKMYTLVNALGFVGGIFGLLVAAQTWMFGFRPRSPWGVVHRWSVGDMRRSLLRGLQSKFKTTDAGIPLIHPVHKRFSVNNLQDLGGESEEQRIERVEERMQTLEMLFKAYYVDDEVFRSLDNANHASKDGYLNNPRSGPGGPGARGVPTAISQDNHHAMFPETEKVDGPGGGYNKPGFSHMFNNRQSVVSLSSDSNSQRHLNPRPDNVPLNDM